MPLLVSMASQIPWDILRGMKGCCLWGWLCSTVQVQIPVELKYVALLWGLPTPHRNLAVGSDWKMSHPIDISKSCKLRFQVSESSSQRCLNLE
jgi:hypothetical protein